MVVLPWALTTIALIQSIQAEYTINVYKGYKQMAAEQYGVLPHGEQLTVGGDYTLEIKSTDLTVDYLLKSCKVVETGVEIIGPPGCLRCTNVFINMVESTNYNYPNALHKASYIHFKPDREYMSFECLLEIYPKGSMDRICERSFVAGLLASSGTQYLYWGAGGLPWWVWLLLILLLLLLLCCCLGLLAFIFFRWKQHKKAAAAAAAAAAAEKNRRIVCMDVKPSFAVGATQTSNCDRTSINRMNIENGAETLVVDKCSVKQNDIEVARIGMPADDKVEVFSGHAGVYNVRNGSTHRYEKNPHITRTRHESELFQEMDRHSYFNEGYEPERSRSVNCIEGYDEVVRYTTDREISEYDHVEREIETNHTTRFYNDPAPSPRYFDRRHRSIPV